MSQWGRVERPETDTHTNGQLIYDRCGPAHRRGEDGITKIGAGKLFSYGKMKLNPTSRHTQKSIPYKDLNVKHTTINFQKKTELRTAMTLEHGEIS